MQTPNIQKLLMKLKAVEFSIDKTHLGPKHKLKIYFKKRCV